MRQLTNFEHRQIFMRDNYRCVYCGRELVGDINDWLSIEVDHLKPSSKGGSDEMDNLVTSCNVCNKMKSDYFPDEGFPEDRAKQIDLIHLHIKNKRDKEQKRWVKALIQYDHYLSKNEMIDVKS